MKEYKHLEFNQEWEAVKAYNDGVGLFIEFDGTFISVDGLNVEWFSVVCRNYERLYTIDKLYG